MVVLMMDIFVFIVMFRISVLSKIKGVVLYFGVDIFDDYGGEGLKGCIIFCGVLNVEKRVVGEEVVEMIGVVFVLFYDYLDIIIG